MKYSFTRVSQNVKTGPIPVTMSHKETCPNACPLKSSGCYAESGHVNIHWSNISTGKRGIEWGELIDNIKVIPKGQLWRMNVAGDLPHAGQMLDSLMLDRLTEANKGKQGFTYTHHRVTGQDVTAWHNREEVYRANAGGFTVNLSANSPEHADELYNLGIAPVVTLVDIDAPKISHTPAGRAIVVCPAVTTDGVTCATCGLCAKRDRRSIVGFPVHGTSKKKAVRVIMLHTSTSTDKVTI